MKKLLFVIIVLIFIDIYAKEIEYNKDGSLTINSKGVKTVVNMDGKTPLGIPIEPVNWLINKEKPIVKFVYSPEYSDEDLTEKIRDIMNNTSKLLLSTIEKNKTKLTDLKLVFSLCRYCKTGYCKRKGKTEFSVVFFEKNKKYAELSIPYIDTLKSDSESTLSSLIVKKALIK
jgi:site-specific DNA-adenine methylase